MTFGFFTKDTSGNQILSSSETSSLLKERISQSSTGSGSRVYTDAVGQTAYGFGIMQSGNAIAGTWGAIRYNITTGVNASSQPTIDWNIQCTNIAPAIGNSCGAVVQYYIFTFTK